MVTQYNAWPCPACGARVTDLARPEALAPEHRVCERCWRAATSARFAARKAELAAAGRDGEDAPAGTPGGQGREGAEMSSHQTASIVIVSDDENRWGADRAQLLAALEAQGWQEVGVGLWREPERETDEDGEDDPFDAPYTRLCRAVPPLPGLGPDDVEATEAALLAGAEGFGWVVSRGLWEGLA